MITTLEHPEGKEFDRATEPLHAGIGEIIESKRAGLWVVVKRRWTSWGRLRLIVEPAGSFSWPIELCPSCGNTAGFRVGIRVCEDCELEWSIDQ